MCLRFVFLHWKRPSDQIHVFYHAVFWWQEIHLHERKACSTGCTDSVPPGPRDWHCRKQLQWSSSNSSNSSSKVFSVCGTRFWASTIQLCVQRCQWPSFRGTSRGRLSKVDLTLVLRCLFRTKEIWRKISCCLVGKFCSCNMLMLCFLPLRITNFCWSWVCNRTTIELHLDVWHCEISHRTGNGHSSFANIQSLEWKGHMGLKFKQIQRTCWPTQVTWERAATRGVDFTCTQYLWQNTNSSSHAISHKGLLNCP